METEPVNDLTIELVVDPSFCIPLTITLTNQGITYCGNLELNGFPIEPEVSEEISISPFDFKDFTDEIMISNFPIIPEFSMGCDGTTYTIRIKNGFNYAEYSWWDTCPEGWEKLGNLAEKLINFCKKKSQEENKK
ncbi:MULTISPECIES: hypothetical protein [unclassified Methanoregula]|uniref:hypothetical protein n=1 Tax=unclassified Methanoregula TaxID=2649730 RepID=UPI0009D1837E|nr:MULTISPECIES: hypothetical protein [unclassified Methanoregula]OPX62557.1 MAG: hypothetical protein A4E33_02306 [Methanoregula sp. PtaB.Bin085]OPY31656.1 MAG: hypothetical protein A4E34_02849 [Methanoregula sp. PtaU1.Bin006]